VAILDVLSRQYRIDQKRIYVAGQSDGGYAVWDLISNRPDRFAAAIVLCGGGDPARAGRLVNLPIWVFHGSADPMVPVSEARNMIQAIQKAGGKPRYTEYKGAGHEIWSRVFAEPELVDWVFAQHL
jgi:predicted peptidase